MLNNANFRVLLFAVTLMLIVNSSIRFARASDSDKKDNVDSTETNENVNSQGTDENKSDDYEETYEYDDSDSDGIAESGNLLSAVIIDVGITGSRLYIAVFQKTSRGYLAFLDDLTVPHTESFSSTENINEDVQSFDKILEEVEFYIQEKDRSNTPLVMKVSSQIQMKFSAEKLNDVFEKIKKLFDTSSFKTTKNSVAVLSEVDERRYLWFTINFRLVLLNGQFENTATALSLDDASLEITIVPTSDEQNKKYITDFKMKGQSVKLYSRSYLGIGIKIARQTIIAAKNGDGSYGSSPCYNENIKGTQYENGQNQGPNTKTHSAVNYMWCKSVIETVVDTYVVSKPQDIYSKKIVALSQFFKTAKEAKLVGDNGGDLTIQSFYDAAKEECGKMYANNDVPNPFLCLDLTYIAVLLEVGLGFPLNTVFTVTNSIYDYDINWLLGAAHNIVEYGIE